MSPRALEQEDGNRRKVQAIDWVLVTMLSACGFGLFTMNNSLIAANSKIESQSKQLDTMEDKLDGINALRERMMGLEVRVSTNEKAISDLRTRGDP